MKKLLSMILALVLVLSSITALATERRVLPTEDENAEMTIYNGLESRYDSDSATGTESSTPSVNTEIWLQVDASGQIDVTVPLVLVFKTNIDGGEATSPSEYKITNRSSADLVVTSINVAKEAKSAANPMTMVAYDVAALAEDTYKVQLAGTKEDGGVTYDLYTASHTADKSQGGLLYLPTIDGEDYATGRATDLSVTMSTGKLSFVTSRNIVDEEDMGMDTTKGVKLLTVTYTVAIDTTNAVGATITNANELFKAPATNP